MSEINKINYEGDLYSKYRPSYSTKLFETIYNFHEQNNGEFNLAVDIGTGTGQVAVELSNKFKKIYGIDNLEEMINNAIKKDNIIYKLSSAENLPFENNSVDMITVATAFHYFNHDEFFNEAKRILKENGTLAIFGYYFPEIKNIKNKIEVNKVLNKLISDILEINLNEKAKYIKNLYRDINFPFKKVEKYITPKNKDITNISNETQGSFLEMDITIDNFNKYIKTASGYVNYIEKNKNNALLVDPVDDAINKIMEIAGLCENDIITAEWPFVLVLIKNDE